MENNFNIKSPLLDDINKNIENDNNIYNYRINIDFSRHKFINSNKKSKQIKRFYSQLPSNAISTSKYTKLNAIPKILFEQFSKIANIYFLIVAFLELFKDISNTNGKPSILLPLIIVVSINGIKDYYEDWKRKKSDDEENNKIVSVYNSIKKKFIEKRWKEITLGDIIKIYENEYFPADCIILKTTEKNNCCHIETKSIDGETNLKLKKSNKDIINLIEFNLDEIDGTELHCQEPNEFIYEFNAKFCFLEKCSFIDINNFILRGCSLKQTKYIYGLVVYVGHDTKIMRNSTKAKQKVSKIEKIMNRQIVSIFLVQLGIGIISSIFSIIQTSINMDNLYYIYPDKNSLKIETTFYYIKEFFLQIGTWILLINNIVPISLLMTLEMVKYIQGLFISWDLNMYDNNLRKGPKVQTSTLNEELGQVKFIFSDKTGTLTKNYMEYKAMSINGIIYGLNKSKREISLKDDYGLITNFNFRSKKFINDLINSSNEEQYNYIHLFLYCLALCHSVIIDDNSLPNIVYKSSSPDETAMVNCSRYFGIIFSSRDSNDNIELLEKNKEGLFNKVKYKIIHSLDYSSERKRMSVLVEMPNKEIYLFTKGADSIVEERLDKNNEKNTSLIKTTNQNLIEFARNGLRTLMIAYKIVSKEEFIKFNEIRQKALDNPAQKTMLMNQAYDVLENNLLLLGATAIEDKLQDDISDALESFIEAGIKIWVLTGDKTDTAKSIAFSCNLIDHNFHIFEFHYENYNNSDLDRQLIIENELKNFFKKYYSLEETDKKESLNKYALIVSLTELNIILSDENLKYFFYSLAIKCNTVLCCRVSPKQKAEMVTLVKNFQPETTTLAIGDGANDVNMICTAGIGIGIMGVEGLQAARASDYCISQFKYLKRLLFVHGRESYRKNSFIVCYNFYKNFLFVLPIFWYGINSFFSGTNLYDPWLYQLFNIVFTCFPILWFGIYDKEVSYDTLKNSPKHYTQGIINKLFHKKRFWKWILYGILHAFIVYLYTFFTCFTVNNGYMHDITSQGTICYSGVVLLVNIKILITTCSHTVISFILFILSILSYYFITWFMSKFTAFDNFNNFKMIMNSFEFFLSSILIIGICILIDRGTDIFCRIFGIISNPLEIQLDNFEKIENKETELNYITDTVKLNKAENNINNDFKGAAFTFSKK